MMLELPTGLGLRKSQNTEITYFFLQEVIDLTTDLLTSQPAESASTTNSSVTVPVKQRWKVGDNCLAVWNQDGQ